jgi:hypothetical protein
VHVLDAELVKQSDEDPLALGVLEPFAELPPLFFVQLRTVPAQEDQAVEVRLHLSHEGAGVGRVGLGHEWRGRLRALDDPLVGELYHALPLNRI